MSEMETDPRMTEGLSQMERPIPGESLTHDPEDPRAFEGPPKFTDVTKAQEEIFIKLTDEETLPGIMQLIDSGDASIMEVTQNMLYAGFNAGQWNPDLMLMLAEPSAYMLMALAEKMNIDYRIDDEPDEEDTEAQSSELTKQLAKKTPKSKKVDKTAVSPAVIEKIESMSVPSLLSADKETAAPTEESVPEEGSLLENPNG
jgi:hypothetical protein